MAEPFDLSEVFVHLGRGATATPLPDFSWSPEYLAGYQARFADDGNEGRLVCVVPQDATWDSWERHPAGDEVVVLLWGSADLVLDRGGRHEVVPLAKPGEFVIVPKGTWHTARIARPASMLFITPGEGTRNESR